MVDPDWEDCPVINEQKNERQVERFWKYEPDRKG